MAKLDDGGPAFPTPVACDTQDSILTPASTSGLGAGNGMSWLDYAAIQVAAGLAIKTNCDVSSDVDYAYCVAATLLAEKRRRESVSRGTEVGTE